MDKKHLTYSEKLASSFTRWVGSTQSVLTHTVVFILCFIAAYFGFTDFNQMLLALTTIVSLEAIYLAIFIQMTVNRTTASLQEVEEDIGEMQEDVEEIQKDVDELQEDVEEMTEEEKEEARRDEAHYTALTEIRGKVVKLAGDIEHLAGKSAQAVRRATKEKVVSAPVIENPVPKKVARGKSKKKAI